MFSLLIIISGPSSLLSVDEEQGWKTVFMFSFLLEHVFLFLFYTFCLCLLSSCSPLMSSDLWASSPWLTFNFNLNFFLFLREYRDFPKLNLTSVHQFLCHLYFHNTKPSTIKNNRKVFVIFVSISKWISLMWKTLLFVLNNEVRLKCD